VRIFLSIVDVFKIATVQILYDIIKDEVRNSDLYADGVSAYSPHRKICHRDNDGRPPLWQIYLLVSINTFLNDN
jgi:hypothetical protein